MSLLATAVPRDEARRPLDRSNPLARLSAAMVLALPNLLLLDAVLALATVTAALAVTLLVSDLPRRFVARATAFVLLGGVGAGLANALGTTGALDDRVSAGVLTSLRVVALVLPGVVAFATIDPVDAADAAVRQLHVPVRGAYGVLAAVRLTPLLTSDWRTRREAERARGIAGGGPLATLRRVASRVVGLLVAAVRRAERVAVALDARGFDLMGTASAGASPWRSADTGWVLGAAVLAVGLAALAVLVPGGRLLVVG